jgi:hypothetical protein
LEFPTNEINKMKKEAWGWILVLLMSVAMGCDPKLSITDQATSVLGDCSPDKPQSLTERSDSEIGFFNPKDSLLYSTVVVGAFFKGGNTNPCSLVERIVDYKNPMSRKFRIVWEGPKGITTDQKIPRALIRFTDQAYQDDIDRNLPDAKGKFPFEIEVKEDSSYVLLPTNRIYKIALRKGYSNLLNEVKCAEVSLSNTPIFDSKSIILRNDSTRSWSNRIFWKPAEIEASKQFLVVRERECITCPEPIPTLTTNTPSIAFGEEVMLEIKGCSTATDFGQGPLEWWEQPAGGSKQLVQRYSYSQTNTRRFKPTTTTTYSVRCQGEWYCKPTAEVSITIQVK